MHNYKQYSRSLHILLYITLGLGLYTASRLAMLVAYHDIFSEYSFWQILSQLFNGVRFDAAIFLVLSAVAWVLFIIPIKFQLYYRLISIYILLLYYFCALCLISDVVYFNFAGRHATNEMAYIMNDAVYLLDMAKLYATPLPFIGFILIYAFITYLWFKIAKLNVAPYLSWKTGVATLLVWVVLVNIGIRGNFQLKPISTADAYAYANADVNLGNLALNGMFTVYKYHKHSKGVTSDIYTFYDNATALQIINDSKSMTSVIPDVITELDKPNVVMIVLEGVSANYFDSFSDNDFSLMPVMDEIARKSIIFTNHYTPEVRSITSIQAALTGIPPMYGLPAIGSGLETSIKSHIAKTFVENGYSTIFIQSSKRRSFYLDAVASSLGFQQYYGMEDMGILLDYPDPNGSQFGWDYETYMILADKIKQLEPPFFTFTFLGTTHLPFPDLPEQFKKYPHDPSTEDGFKNTLVYTDWSLQQFFDSIKDEPWYDNTIFIITSDHTAPHFKHPSHRESYRVPFIVYTPSNTTQIVYDNVTSHLDIPETLTDIIGLEKIPNEYLTSSMFSKDNDSYMVTNAWNTATLITKNETLTHSFDSIIGFTPEDMSEEEKHRLEQLTLAYYQIGFIFADTAKKRRLLQ